MTSRSEDLLSQVRTAAEARWPGCDVRVTCDVDDDDDGTWTVIQWVDGAEFSTSGSTARDPTESEALERMLAEVRR